MVRKLSDTRERLYQTIFLDLLELLAKLVQDDYQFLSLASDSYKARYAISPDLYLELQEKIKTESERLSIQAKGSLFFEKETSLDCPFAKEVWIYPDGTKSHCPNPENRFGDSKQVSCKTCVMK